MTLMFLFLTKANPCCPCLRFLLAGFPHFAHFCLKPTRTGAVSLKIRKPRNLTFPQEKNLNQYPNPKIEMLS
jgi:hypothetical protein